MSGSYEQMNWCPKSFQEFCSMARIGRVKLNIHTNHYPWLYENVLPFSAQVKSLFSSVSYEMKIVREMIRNEETFIKVHKDKGIDLFLLPKK